MPHMEHQPPHPELASLPDEQSLRTAERLRSLASVDKLLSVSVEQRRNLESLCTPQQPGWLERVLAGADEVAVLLFDSARGLQRGAVPGYRSGAGPVARIMQFACEGGTIDIRIELVPHSDQVMVTGQASPELGCKSVRVLAPTGASTTADATVADDGYFELTVPMSDCGVEFSREKQKSVLIERIGFGDGVGS